MTKRTIKFSIKSVIAISFLLYFTFFSISAQYQPSANAVQTDTYEVGPQDVLRISVAGRAMIDETFPVSANGTINFPLLGDVPVSGLTTQNIEQKITDSLAQDYLVDPKVYVAVEKYNSQKVIVWGEVKSPGIYVLMGKTSLLEIIAQAGGMTDKASKRVKLIQNAPDVITSADVNEAIRGALSKREPNTLDIRQLVKDGTITDKLLVTSGDVIVVEAQKDSDINEQQVYVTGCLNKPGAYEYQNGLTALSLCIMAGGFTTRAALQRATLIRNMDGTDKVYQLNLDKIKKGKSADFKLKPGDRLNVPESFW